MGELVGGVGLSMSYQKLQRSAKLVHPFLIKVSLNNGPLIRRGGIVNFHVQISNRFPQPNHQVPMENPRQETLHFSRMHQAKKESN